MGSEMCIRDRIYSDVDAFDKYVLGAVEEYLEEASEFAVKKSKSQ